MLMVMGQPILDWIGLYLVVGLVLAEGGEYAVKRTGKPFKTSTYVVLLLAWPAVALLYTMRAPWRE